jgi:predicted RNase H-like HicB family nuclease
MRQVILIPDESGGYVVEVPSLPGYYSQGDTEAEALENIKEAIAFHIEDMIVAGEEVCDDVPPTLLKAVQCQNCQLYPHANAGLTTQEFIDLLKK